MNTTNLLTREQAFKILKDHSFEPTQLTAYHYETREPILGSSFISEMGDKMFYDKKKVYKWLGY